MSDQEKVVEQMKELRSHFRALAGITSSSESRKNYVESARTIDEAIELLKAQEPRLMTWDEVKKKINSGEYVFTECEKEGQWMRYGDARLSVDQGDSCRIAFLISRRGDDPYVRWWMIYYENYNKTWRCWTSRPTDEQREATPWY